MWQIVADCGDSFWEKVHFPSSIILLHTLSQATSHVKTLHGVSAHTPRSIGLHSTEHRLTLHGASAHTPRSIGLHSTEHRLTPHGASAYSPRSIGLFSTEHRQTLQGWQLSGLTDRIYRTLIVLFLLASISVAPPGLLFCWCSCTGGLRPPSVVFRTSGAFPRIPIKMSSVGHATLHEIR